MILPSWCALRTSGADDFTGSTGGAAERRSAHVSKQAFKRFRSSDAEKAVPMSVDLEEFEAVKKDEHARRLHPQFHWKRIKKV